MTRHELMKRHANALSLLHSQHARQRESSAMAASALS